MEGTNNLLDGILFGMSNEVMLKKHMGEKNLNTVLKIYPTSADLSTVQNEIRCTEEKCEDVFNSISNLNLHLYKTHKKNVMQSNSCIKQFHCPEDRCIYHRKQHFKTKKLLKQHYLKVHCPKVFKCEKCNEGFASRGYKNVHFDYCGILFKCNDCVASYPKYESLLTHARRKNHTIKNKVDFLINENKDKDKEKKVVYKPTQSFRTLKKLKYILPKPKKSPNSNAIFLFVNPINKSDQSIQTESIPHKIRNNLMQLKKDVSCQSRHTKGTQTGYKNKRLTVETQTLCDSTSRKITGHKCQSTQTNDNSEESVSSNTDFNLNTNFVDPTCNILCSQTTTCDKDSSHSVPSDIIRTNLENLDIFNCNTETQTDSIFDDDLFNYCDYYSNMYTQTSEDMFLNSLELNNIETQTVDEMLKSVESQTIMSQNNKSNINVRDISHMETQTDVDLKHLLEGV